MWNFLKNDRVQWSLIAMVSLIALLMIPWKEEFLGIRLLLLLNIAGCFIKGFVTNKRWQLWLKIILTVAVTTILILILTKVL